MYRPVLSWPLISFQSSSGLLAGCNVYRPVLSWPLISFQSSSGLLAGCNAAPGRRRGRDVQVSILIRPSGRMQPPAILRSRLLKLVFQSSSGLLAGCNCGLPGKVRFDHSFQSASGLLAGCNHVVSACTHRYYNVSILIRPSGRMQQGRPTSDWQRSLVSILIRPSGRMQQGRPTSDWQRSLVSILIRPSGRMQPALLMLSGGILVLFQSSSGLLAGCNRGKGRGAVGGGRVSILIRPSGRMQPYHDGDGPQPGIVSILIRPSGRMQRLTL